MRSKFRPRARMVALACCVGALGSFAMAAPAMATAPAGAACQTDGKISGRGSTLQGGALTALIGGYATDVCGSVGAASNLNTGFTGDPAAGNMLVYNWSNTGVGATSPTVAGARGSGEGLAAMACRTDAFGGTDIPYNDGSQTPATGTMPWLWADIPAVGSGNGWPYFDPAFGPDGQTGCDTFYGNGTNGSGSQVAYEEPYPPAPTTGCGAASPAPACYPSGTNAASAVMSFPIAVASAALGVDFHLNAPVPSLGTNTGTGGTGRCWEITSLNAQGQTLGSAEIGPANVGAGETQVLNWGAVNGATTYDIYGTAGSVGPPATCSAFTATSVVATGITTTTFTDTGAALTAGSLPTTNSAQLAGCPTAATQVQLTSSQISSIFSGTDTNWDQLTSSAFAWSGCNEPITRVVRGDISGTTQEMKTYLRSVDGSRVLCDGTNTWTTLSTYGNNTVWPGGNGDACAGVTAPTVGIGTGGGASCPGSLVPIKGVVCAVAETQGSITYGDLSNWKSTPSVMYAEVVPTSGTTGVLPGSSATLGTGTPNCDTSFSGNTPGAGAGTDFVGLDDTGATPDEPALTNWGTDASNGNGGTVPASDITNLPGSLKWPICTLTYDMVYSGLSGGAGAIGGLTADQRRTLYTFFAYVLSPDGQGRLKAAGYLPLPSAWATAERTGFETGF